MIIWEHRGEHCSTVRTSAVVRRRDNDDDGCTRCGDNERLERELNTMMDMGT